MYTRALVHELKTPLSPLLVSCDLLNSKIAHYQDESLIQLIKNINHATNNLSRRIDELLDFARYEMGIFELRMMKYDFLSLINELIDLIEPRAKAFNILINTEFPDTLPKIRCDRDRMQQVLLNLLDNAIKYTPKGGSISLSAKEHDSGILVEIVDQGIGIKYKKQQQIFNFYSLMRSKGDKLSGLGLGLPLSKMIIEKHNGTIQLKSKEGKGSTFSLWLPNK
jgi:signal transduction histidine kinase